jgi:hypothetical protein
MEAIAILLVIPGWSEGPDPESRDSNAQLRIMVRANARPRNDAIS